MNASILKLSPAQCEALVAALHRTPATVATWRYLRPRTRLERALRLLLARNVRRATHCPRFVSVI